MFTYLWRGEEWLNEFDKGLMQRLEAAGIHLENAFKKELGIKGDHDTHSKPGEYPYLQSSRLRTSITHERDDAKKCCRVGSLLIYLRYLWRGTRYMDKRKSLEDKMNEERATLTSITTGKKIQ